MTLALVTAAAVGVFGVVWFWFVAYVLADVETERTDLAREASPCTQTLTRYQR